MEETSTEIHPAKAHSLMGRSSFVPVLLILWMGFLATQAAITSNPLQLNLKQLHAAQHLWLGKIKDLKGGEIEIKQDLKQPTSKLKTAKIKSLGRSQVKLQQEYLIPVYQVSAQEFEVVPVPVKDQMLYPIYPWTPEIAQRLKTVEETINQGVYPELNYSKEK